MTVLEGDCRISLKRFLDRHKSRNVRANGDEAMDCNLFDRISLGLLPSSEGGWAIAVSCLRENTGGWLHVHGNVATVERDNWAHWLCYTLTRFATAQDGRDDWIAVCAHVERVKSFAPKIDHVVADVFVGPRNSPKGPKTWSERTTGVFNSSGKFVRPSPQDISPPSCALTRRYQTLRRAVDDICLFIEKLCWILSG